MATETTISNTQELYQSILSGPSLPDMSLGHEESLVVFTIAIFMTVIWIVSLFKKPKEIKIEVPVVQTEVDINKSQLLIGFIEKLTKEKYTYYMYLELLPIYLDGKIPEKNKVQEIKEKIYASVVGSLTTEIKQEFLKFFTEKGIEIFVHQRIIILMNETDMTASDTPGSRFIGDLRNADLDKIL